MLEVLAIVLIAVLWWAFIWDWLVPVLSEWLVGTGFGRWMERIFLKLARFFERSQ